MLITNSHIQLFVLQQICAISIQKTPLLIGLPVYDSFFLNVSLNNYGIFYKIGIPELSAVLILTE